MSDEVDVLIVGAGVAGLTLARELMDAGRSVRLLDKGFYAGGRLCSRRVSGDDRIDHGAAQFVLGSDHPWLQIPWVRHMPQDGEAVLAMPAPDARTLATALARDLDVRSRVRASQLTYDGQWTVDDAAGGSWHGQAVVLTAPAPQTAELLRPVAAEAAAAISRIALSPRWVLTGVIDRQARVLVPLLQPLVEAVERKPVTGGADQHMLRLQAGDAWSSEHVDADVDAVQAALTVHLARAGVTLRGDVHVHRWRYAIPAPATQHALPPMPDGLYVGGDWTQSGAADRGVQRAVASGQRLAAQILTAQSATSP